MRYAVEYMLAWQQYLNTNTVQKHTYACMTCPRSLLHISPAVPEEALGHGERTVLAVTGMLVPEGTTSVVSVEGEVIICTRN